MSLRLSSSLNKCTFSTSRGAVGRIRTYAPEGNLISERKLYYFINIYKIYVRTLNS